VLAAVHHAEVVALRVGEPFGSLVLAVAVTVIEVALIVTLMLSGATHLRRAGAIRDIALTVVASVLTVVPGQATRLQGGVHLVVLAAFLFLAINP
jgi:Ca2+:H+ antiporter